MECRMKALVLASFVTLLAGCMSFEIEGDGRIGVDSRHGSETVHGSLYGFRWASHDVEKSSDGLGLYRVEFSTNALYLLVSTFTLGVYVPQTVEWWCQAPEPGDDGPLLSRPR